MSYNPCRIKCILYVLFQVVNASFAHNSWRFIMGNLHLLNKILQRYNNHSFPFSFPLSQSLVAWNSVSSCSWLPNSLWRRMPRQCRRSCERPSVCTTNRATVSFPPPAWRRSSRNSMISWPNRSWTSWSRKSIVMVPVQLISMVSWHFSLFTLPPPWVFRFPCAHIRIISRYTHVCVYRSHVCVVHSSSLLKVSHVNISAPPTHGL